MSFTGPDHRLVIFFPIEHMFDSWMTPVGRSLSWDDFESAHLLQFLPFEEAQLGDRTMDIALFDFGEKHVGRTLSASDVHVLFGRGIILHEGVHLNSINK